MCVSMFGQLLWFLCFLASVFAAFASCFSWFVCLFVFGRRSGPGKPQPRCQAVDARPHGPGGAPLRGGLPVAGIRHGSRAPLAGKRKDAAANRSFLRRKGRASPSSLSSQKITVYLAVWCFWWRIFGFGCLAAGVLSSKMVAFLMASLLPVPTLRQTHTEGIRLELSISEGQPLHTVQSARARIKHCLQAVLRACKASIH